MRMYTTTCHNSVSSGSGLRRRARRPARRRQPTPLDLAAPPRRPRCPARAASTRARARIGAPRAARCGGSRWRPPSPPRGRPRPQTRPRAAAASRRPRPSPAPSRRSSARRRSSRRRASRAGRCCPRRRHRPRRRGRRRPRGRPGRTRAEPRVFQDRPGFAHTGHLCVRRRVRPAVGVQRPRQSVVRAPELVLRRRARAAEDGVVVVVVRSAHENLQRGRATCICD